MLRNILLVLGLVVLVMGEQGPEQIHLALTGDPSEMSVMWVTQEAPEAPVVDYGLDTSLGMSAVASSHTYSEGGWSGFIQTAVMTNLKPGTAYFYKVKDGSDIFRFMSAPAESDFPDVSLVTFADVGTDSYPGAPLNDHYVASLVNASMPPHAVLLQGDIAYDKGNDSTWDAFFQQVQPFAAHVPLMTAPGNEDHAYNFSSYRNRVFMPTQSPTETLAPWWYSFDLSFVHVVSMCTEASHDGGTGYWPNTTQYEWLEADLAKAHAQRATRPWIIVMGHRPLYCSSNDYYDCNMWGPKAREALEPLFQQYHVDLYLSGHVHSYERTYPVFNGTATSESYQDAAATVHAMVGSGGAGLTSHWSEQPEWSAKRIIAYGVGHIHANKTALRFDFVQTGQNGTVSDGVSITDTFTLIKSQ